MPRRTKEEEGVWIPVSEISPLLDRVEAALEKILERQRRMNVFVEALAARVEEVKPKRRVKRNAGKS